MGTPNIITALDIGEAHTVVLVTEISGSRLRYLGHGIADSSGSCERVIVDLAESAASVQEAIEKAELSAGLPIQRAVVGVSGPHIHAANSKGRIVLGLRPREVSRQDIRQAAKTAYTTPHFNDRQPLHLFPQNFVLDEQDCIRNPVGTVGRQLEVHVHIVTAAADSIQSIVRVMNRAGIYVEDTMYRPLASSAAVLHADERELGVCVCDLGVGSMDILVLRDGVVVYSSSIHADVPVRKPEHGLTLVVGEKGTKQATLRTPAVTFKPASPGKNVSSLENRTLRLVPQRSGSEGQEARARDLIEMIEDNLRQAGVLHMLGAGVVFVGAGARLPGLIEHAEAALPCPIRIGVPMPMPKLPTSLCQPEFAPVIGMALYTHRARMLRIKN